MASLDGLKQSNHPRQTKKPKPMKVLNNNNKKIPDLNLSQNKAQKLLVC